MSFYMHSLDVRVANGRQNPYSSLYYRNKLHREKQRIALKRNKKRGAAEAAGAGEGLRSDGEIATIAPGQVREQRLYPPSYT